MTVAGSSEERCAALIRMGMNLGNLGGMVLVDEGYSDDEIRVANETVKRAKGDKFSVSRGKITMTVPPGEFNPFPPSPTPFRSATVRVTPLP
jgi:hypothetical protein